MRCDGARDRREEETGDGLNDTKTQTQTETETETETQTQTQTQTQTHETGHGLDDRFVELYVDDLSRFAVQGPHARERQPLHLFVGS